MAGKETESFTLSDLKQLGSGLGYLIAVLLVAAALWLAGERLQPSAYDLLPDWLTTNTGFVGGIKNGAWLAWLAGFGYFLFRSGYQIASEAATPWSVKLLGPPLTGTVIAFVVSWGIPTQYTWSRWTAFACLLLWAGGISRGRRWMAEEREYWQLWWQDDDPDD